MREIKFRSWVTSKATNTSWMNHEVEFTGGKINDIFNEKENRFGEIKYMQFTGLKDKNGVDIYEGDIVEIANEEFRHKIEWIGYEESGYPIGWALFPNTFTYEVIGNIYENPKLLEESK